LIKNTYISIFWNYFRILELFPYSGMGIEDVSSVILSYNTVSYLKTSIGISIAIID